MTQRWVLRGAFLLVHVWLAWWNLAGPGNPFGDVAIVYRDWVFDGVERGYWVPAQTDWVYPILAFPPMLLAGALGPDLYGLSWLLLVSALNLVALEVLLRRSTSAAWWWTGFLLALGPVSVGRIDAVAAGLAILAVCLLRRRQDVAAVLLTAGAWVKIWPGALLAAVVVAGARPRRSIAVAALTSIGIGAVALASGVGSHVWGFLLAQSGRGLQIESVLATPGMWLAARFPETWRVEYSTDILTFQLTGPSSRELAAASTALLAVLVLGIAALAWRARRAAADSGWLLTVTSLALVVALIVGNKVGSPQFVTWLAAPVILGMLTGWGHRLRFVLGAVLVLAALTQVIYPLGYDALLALEPGVLFALSARNLGFLLLLGWAGVQLWRAAEGKQPG